MDMIYENISNIADVDDLKRLHLLSTSFNAKIVEAEKFDFGEKIYFCIHFCVPEYKGTQYDDGNGVEFSVPEFSTVKVLEGNLKDGKYWWSVKEITIEELDDFYSNIDYLRNSFSLAGKTAIPYYMGEDSSFDYFNAIKKEWNRIFQ